MYQDYTFTCGQFCTLRLPSLLLQSLQINAVCMLTETHKVSPHYRKNKFSFMLYRIFRIWINPCLNQRVKDFNAKEGKKERKKVISGLHFYGYAKQLEVKCIWYPKHALHSRALWLHFLCNERRMNQCLCWNATSTLLRQLWTRQVSTPGNVRWTKRIAHEEDGSISLTSTATSQRRKEEGRFSRKWLIIWG